MVIKEAVETLLADAGFDVHIDRHSRLIFENATILGFVSVSLEAAELIPRWRSDESAFLANYDTVLRSASAKAWNIYSIFLASGKATDEVLESLIAIEEDLSSTRKIARVGIESENDLRSALLAILPLQSAAIIPELDGLRSRLLAKTQVAASTVDLVLTGSDEQIRLFVEAK